MELFITSTVMPLDNSAARRRVGGSEISIGPREEIVVDRESEKEVHILIVLILLTLCKNYV